MEMRKSRKKDVILIWMFIFILIVINIIFPERWYLGSDSLGLMILLAIVMHVGLNSGKIVMKIEDDQIKVAHWLSGKLRSIGAVTDYHLVIQKDEIYFRKEDAQDTILGRPVPEDEWLAHCFALQEMPFDGFTITYNKAKQAGTH